MENYSNDDDSGEPTGALTTGPHRNQIARRDFAGTSLAVSNSATDALVAKARADTEARWIMAMRRPRNMDDVRQDIMAECKRPGFAAVATYARPVGGGKVAEGLSIRFAEVAARCMGNMQPDVQTIYDDASTRIVRVTVTDFESNVTWSRDLSIAKTVERKQLKKGQRPLGERINSYGDRVYIVEATEDDTAVKEAAMVSKAARTLILRVVPGHLQDEAFKLCRKVAADRDAKDPAGARNQVFDAFGGMGIKPTDLEAWLGHAIDLATTAEFEQLRGLYSAIREGEITWAECLAEAAERHAAGKTKPATAPAPAADPVPDARPAAPATMAPAQTAQAKPVPPPTQPAAEPAKAPQTASQAAPRTAQPSTGGKGAAALKSTLGAKPAPAAAAPVQPAPPPAEPTPAPAPVELPPDEPPPREGWEDRSCASCGVVLEVEIGTPPGAQCYVCRQA